MSTKVDTRQQGEQAKMLGMSLGKRIQAMRERRELSREDLARLVGITTSGLKKIEDDLVSRPRSSTIRLMADVFKVAPDALRTGLKDVAAVDEKPESTLLLAIRRMLAEEVDRIAPSLQAIAERQGQTNLDIRALNESVRRVENSLTHR